MIRINLELIYSNQSSEREHGARGQQQHLHQFIDELLRNLNFYSDRARIVSRPFHFVSMFWQNIYVSLSSFQCCCMVAIPAYCGSWVHAVKTQFSLSLLVSALSLMFEWFIVIFQSSSSISMLNLHLCQQQFDTNIEMVRTFGSLPCDAECENMIETSLPHNMDIKKRCVLFWFSSSLVVS